MSGCKSARVCVRVCVWWACALCALSGSSSVYYAVVDDTVSHGHASNPVFQAYHEVIIFGSEM